MSGYQLVETCCGSAALSLFRLGAKRPLLPYQGGKWRYRHSLGQIIDGLGFEGRPRHVTLTDPGPWGTVMGVVLTPERRTQVVDRLRDLAQQDARHIFDALQGRAVAEDEVELASEYLFLQRLSFSGKAVGIRNGCWSSPGFNASSAYGLPGTDRFGAVNPMIPSLIRVLEGYDTTLDPTARISCRRGSAQTPRETQNARHPTLVYIDPPYRATTAYPNGTLSREQVVALALAWHSAGATVLVSEAEALDALVADGWQARQLYAGRQDTSPFRGKQEEWVTFSPAT